MELITGHYGVDHVSSADDATLYASSISSRDVVLKGDDNLVATILGSNSVQIGTGGCLLQGHFARVEQAETVQIQSGTPGVKRNDLIVARYTLESGNVQGVSLEVITGTPRQGEPIDPQYQRGSINGGDIRVDFPLWRVTLVDATINSVTRIMPVLENYDDAIKSMLAELTNNGIVKLENGGTGVDNTSRTANTVFAAPSGSTGSPTWRKLVASDIPNLDGSKITSGTISNDRLNIIPLSKGGFGTNITNLQAGVAFMSPYGNTGSPSWRKIHTSDIGSGTLGMLRGGTGVSASTVAANRVLASPSSGSAGAVSYRALVENDLPSISPSKIAGTIPINKGGTGQTTIAGKTFTRNTTNTSSGSVSLKKYGLVCTLNGWLKLNKAVSSGATLILGTVSEKPNTTQYAVGTTGSKGFYVTVETGGNVVLNAIEALTSGVNIFFGMTYLVTS